MAGIESEPVRILLVEADEDDYMITRDLLLGQDRTYFALDWQRRYAKALDVIRERRHDLYLIDYRLGERTGLDLVREAFAGEPLAPVILLTRHGDYEVDLEAAQLGVTDYLVKGELEPLGLERSIRYAVRHHRVLRDLRRSEERYALAVRAANDGIWDWDLESGQVYFSSRWKALVGVPDELQPDRPEAWFELVHRDDVERLRTAIDEHVAGHTPHFEDEHRMRGADGSWRWVLSRGVATRDTNGRATRMAGSLSDVTDRHRAEQRLVHDALHDGLTSLPNRALFMDRLDQALKRIERDGKLRCGLLFLDVDRFKLVNDSLSHAVGDRLLVALARRLSATLRPGDTVARLGGDEFTILLDDVGSEDSALAVAGRIGDALRKPLHVDGHELFVTVSSGLALDAPRIDAAELLRNADIAMYDAKRQGGARCAVYDVSMHARVVSRMSRETELRQAIEQERLRTFFQPIVDLHTGAIKALEALARWPADLPEVQPAEFIPIAEDTGLIEPLGRLVLRTATTTLGEWRRDGLVADDVCVSVNISGRQLIEETLRDEVRDALAAAGLDGNALWLEITESTLMEDPERVWTSLAQLRKLGVAVQLDDFGTGYSSLTLLHHFPGDTLKIDRDFVATMGRRGESDLIVRSIVALAHSLGLNVIAEGIDDPEQVHQLRALRCEYGQGFLFSRPLAAPQVEELLATWNSAPLNGAAPVPGAATPALALERQRP